MVSTCEQHLRGCDLRRELTRKRACWGDANKYKVMRMEADRMRDLVLSEQDVETERAVVLEERTSAARTCMT